MKLSARPSIDADGWRLTGVSLRYAARPEPQWLAQEIIVALLVPPVPPVPLVIPRILMHLGLLASAPVRRTRILAVLAYNTEPGISLFESASMTLYGRLGTGGVHPLLRTH